MNKFLLLRHVIKLNSKGFTLLELLIALTIASVSFLAIIPLLLNTMGVNKNISIATKAKEAAVQKVEEYLSFPYDTIDDILNARNGRVNPQIDYVKPDGSSSVATDPTAFKRTTQVDSVPVSATYVAQDPKPVIITSVVEYTYKGEKKTRSFSTMWSF